MEKRKHFSLLNILIQMAYVPSIKEVVIHSAKETDRAEINTSKIQPVY